MKIFLIAGAFGCPENQVVEIVHVGITAGHSCEAATASWVSGVHTQGEESRPLISLAVAEVSEETLLRVLERLRAGEIPTLEPGMSVN